MGGGQALTIGLSHLDLFSRIAGFSSVVGAALARGDYKPLIADSKEVNDRLALLWVGCGTEFTAKLDTLDVKIDGLEMKVNVRMEAVDSKIQNVGMLLEAYRRESVRATNPKSRC